ncbi:MAG: hypothetical protein ACRDV2_17695, partial [Actinomycetes bacterium]
MPRTTVAVREDYVVRPRPDDVLVPRGVQALADALDASGSVLAVSTSDPGAISAARSTTVAQSPALLEQSDPSATMWRRDFLARRPEWPTAPALVRGLLARTVMAAHRIDVVAEPLVAAQVRSAGSGTELRLLTAELGGVADRLDDLHGVGGEIADADLRRHWYLAVVEPELRTACMHLREAEDSVRVRIVERVAEIAEVNALDVEATIPAIHRLHYHLARRRLFPELMDVVKAESSGELRLLPAVRHRRSWYGDYPFVNDATLAVPREIYRLDEEFALRSRVDAVEWEGTSLQIEGYAYLALLNADDDAAQRLALALVRNGTGDRIKLPVERVCRPDVTARAREAA